MHPPPTPSSPTQQVRAYRFGSYRLDLRSRELSRDGRRVRLAEKPFVVLTALLERPGEVVGREELRRRLWPDGTTVDFDNNLNSAVAALRERLRDSARRPRFVETLPRIGYRFVADVQVDGPGRFPSGDRSRPVPAGVPSRQATPTVAAAAAPSAKPRHVTLGAALVLGFLLLSTLVWQVVRSNGDPAAGASPDDLTIDRLAAVPAGDEARAAYLRGRYLLKRHDGGALQAAVDSLGIAIRLDPGFAPARATRAEALARTALAGAEPRGPRWIEARGAAQEALALDPRSATAHRVLAMVALHLDWDRTTARRELERALESDPRDGQTHLALAALRSASGDHAGALAAAQRAVELDPASHLVRSDLGFFHLAAGRFEDAQRACRAALELEPDFEPALHFLVLASERLEDWTAAAAAVRRLGALANESRLAEPVAVPLPPTTVDEAKQIVADHHYRQLERARGATGVAASWLNVALAHAALGQRQEALDALARALERRETFLVYVTSYPQLVTLHGDPEFERLVRRIEVARPTDPADRAS